MAFVIGAEPFELALHRHHYNFTIGSDVAFVNFDQQENWGGTQRRTRESRARRKVDSAWKIVNTSAVDMSSYESRMTPSFHLAKERSAPTRGLDSTTAWARRHGSWIC